MVNLFLSASVSVVGFPSSVIYSSLLLAISFPKS